MGMPRRQPRALRSAAQPVCGDLPATHIREECWWWQVKAGGRESGARGAGVGRWNSRDIPGERRSCRSYMLPGNSRSENERSARRLSPVDVHALVPVVKERRPLFHYTCIYASQLN